MTPSNQTVENTIIANGTEISVISSPNGEDYISLTDIARHRNPEFPADVIKNWLRLRSTIEYLGVWEEINNPNFKLVEFDQFKNAAGSNTFVMSPTKWIRETRAVGIRTKSGRYGGGGVVRECAERTVDSACFGFLLNLNSTSYVIINVLNKMKVIVLH